MFCLPYLRWKHPEWERPIKVAYQPSLLYTPLPQVPLIFPIIYIICSVLVTIVPMVASPRETGYGCAIIATGVPVYFIFVSEDLITKPACVHKLLGMFLQNLDHHLAPFL